MKRCGDDELHDRHTFLDDKMVWRTCDGRTRNESMVGQLTVAELREALDGEQDGAIVAVEWSDRRVSPLAALALMSDRPKGSPVFMLRQWQPVPDEEIG